MRSRTRAGLTAALLLALALPAAGSAHGDHMLVVDNPFVDCDLPLPSTMVAGDLGTVVWVEDPAEIDKVTMSAEDGASVEDVSFGDGWHDAQITISDAVSAYVVWSCAPLNGEPVLQNDPQEV